MSPSLIHSVTLISVQMNTFTPSGIVLIKSSRCLQTALSYTEKKVIQFRSSFIDELSFPTWQVFF